MKKKIILFLSLSLLLTSVVYASPIDNNNKDNFREVKSTIIDNKADMEELKEEGVVFRSPKTTRLKEDVDVLTDEESEYKEVRSIIIDNKDDMEKVKEEDIIFRKPNKNKPNNISLLTDEENSEIGTYGTSKPNELWDLDVEGGRWYTYSFSTHLYSDYNYVPYYDGSIHITTFPDSQQQLKMELIEAGTDEVIATFNNVIDDETWWIIDNLPTNRSYYIRFSSPLGSSISGEGYIA